MKRLREDLAATGSSYLPCGRCTNVVLAATLAPSRARAGERICEDCEVEDRNEIESERITRSALGSAGRDRTDPREGSEGRTQGDAIA